MVTDYATQLPQTNTLPQDRLGALYQAIQRMNSVYELPELLAYLLDRVLEDTGGLRGYLLLAQEPATDDDGSHLEVKAARGDGVDVAQMEADILRVVSRTVVRDVLQRGEPRVIEDLRQDARYKHRTGPLSSHHKWQSILAIPLKVADRLIGLMYIEHPGRNAFPNPDLDFLNAFAGQAAVAIDRAQQSQRRIEELERLNEVSRSVVRVLDLDQVLIRILREATQMLDVETGSVLLCEGDQLAWPAWRSPWSADGNQRSQSGQGADRGKIGDLLFRVSVQEGRPVHISRRLKAGEGIAGWVAQQGEPLLVRDVHHDPRWYGEVETGFFTRSVLCVPLKIDEHVIGALQVLNKKGPVGFTERDLTLLSAFATTATVAIENARLFAEARQARELRALNEMAAVLSSSLELDAILETGLVKALDVMRAEAGAVSLMDGETGELVVAAARGWRAGGLPVGTRIPADEGLLGRVVASGEIIATNDVRPELRAAVEAFRDQGVQAMMLAPMRAGGQVTGVLSAMSYVPRTFTAEEVDVLSAIGGMFGVAVENARLYGEVRSNLTQLAYFNEVGGALTSSLDLDRVLQVIMTGVASLIGVERASIFLVEEASDDLVLEYSADVREAIRLPVPWPGVVGWVATHGEPVIVNDVRDDPRFLPDIDAITGFGTRSILGAPLKLDGRVIGVVEALNKLDSPFTEKDRNLLVDFSKWAAIALHNARLYRELDEATERLASAEAVAVMGDMALNLTHRLSNRISVARINASRIQAKCKEELKNPYLAEKLEEIRRAAVESLTIVRRIREPFEMADVEPLDVSACLAEALSSFHIESGIKVLEQYQSKLPPVMATREKLIESFCHVIGNALDAMEDSGQLWLSTRRRLDGLVEVVVADDGQGIPPDVQPHLFELGFTTKPDEGGLGLGLWWTRAYVSRLGGQVKLRSIPGQGTAVSIRLPAAQERLA
jgi:GAF domain-containing protein